MHTARTILLIVAAALAVAGLGIVLALVVAFGPVGLAVAGVGGLALGVTYQLVIEPWHIRWGATADEVARSFPGDDLLSTDDVRSTTRAITVDAAPEAVWPWLVQIGFGRGGWYSYDWIDNDGRPSATRLVPELQALEIGDHILMTPEMGFEVRELEEPTALVSQAPDGTTWSLCLLEREGQTRLVSRFRNRPTPGAAAVLWNALAGPGAFVMERRMLLGIRQRAGRSRTLDPGPPGGEAGR